MSIIALARIKPREILVAANDSSFGEKKCLSDREHEIMELVTLGKSNKEIGSALNISPLTAKNHLQRIFKKLGAGNRIEAMNLYTPPPGVEIFRRGKR